MSFWNLKHFVKQWQFFSFYNIKKVLKIFKIVFLQIEPVQIDTKKHIITPATSVDVVTNVTDVSVVKNKRKNVDSDAEAKSDAK